MMFSANYFGFDDNETIDGERTGDRISAIPFQEMPDIPPHEFLEMQRKFKNVVDSEEKPVELLIGEIGDFVLSDEFGEKRLGTLGCSLINVTAQSSREQSVPTMPVTMPCCGSYIPFLSRRGVKW